jgi:hypothetical protein
MVWGLVSSALLLEVTGLVAAREGRRPRDFGVRFGASSANRFVIGAGLGLVVYGLTIVADSTIAGPIQFSRVATADFSAVFFAVGTFLALSVMEEVGFRGYPLRSLAPALGAWRAQVLVAVAFGASHLLFGWTLQTVILGVIPSAFLFGAAALTFGDLAAPIGLHAALNLARWSTGEMNTPGIWTMSVADPSRERLAAVAPTIGIAVTALFAFALWWYDHRRAGQKGAAA